MKDGMSNHRGDHGDGEIRKRKYIAKGEGQGFPVRIDDREFTHKEIRVKQKDDKRDLNQGAPDAGDQPAIFLVRTHGWMIPAAAPRICWLDGVHSWFPLQPSGRKR